MHGVRGDAGCMAKARLFVTTGRPVQPHDSEWLEGLEVRCRWAVIPHQIVDQIGLEGSIDNPRNFKASWCNVWGVTTPAMVHVRFRMVCRCMLSEFRYLDVIATAGHPI